MGITAVGTSLMSVVVEVSVESGNNPARTEAATRQASSSAATANCLSANENNLANKRDASIDSTVLTSDSEGVTAESKVISRISSPLAQTAHDGPSRSGMSIWAAVLTATLMAALLSGVSSGGIEPDSEAIKLLRADEA